MACAGNYGRPSVRHLAQPFFENPTHSMIHPALASLLERYQPQSTNDYQNAVREIVQEIALLGLRRTPFYDHAAFYGGSALRIFHGLQRFSEDLDFSLLRPLPGFSLKPYLGAVADELAAWGFEFRAEGVEKSMPSPIESAFLKGSTVINLLHVEAPPEIASRLPKRTAHPGQVGDRYRPSFLELPPKSLPGSCRRPIRSAFMIHRACSPASSMPCCAWNWKSRVKGRDFYEVFVWYVGRRTPLNLDHLEARMRQSGHLDSRCAC